MICVRAVRTLIAHPEVITILAFELFQRFSYFMFQTMLFLYIKHELKYSLSESFAIYHAFLALGFTSTIFFTVIGDKWLSKYCTIMIASLIALIGNIFVILAACSAGPYGITSLFQRIATYSVIGLLMHSIGFGGMREVARSFGSDQFNLPKEERHLRTYYQLFYYCKAIGSVAGIVTAPLLRMQVECFGQMYCFPLGFGVGTFGLFLAIASLIAGAGSLDKGQPTGSVVTETCSCITTALRNYGERCGPTWLDNASVVFVDTFICDVRATLKVLVLFIPLPIFWALYELQFSLWIYQGSRMIWPVSRWAGLYVEPDQMPVATHLTIFVAVPVLECCLHWLFNYIPCCRTSLRRALIGALLAVIASIVAILIELKIEPTLEKFPLPGEGQIAVYNPSNYCSLEVRVDYEDRPYNKEMIVPIFEVRFMTLPVKGTQKYIMHLLYSGCKGIHEVKSKMVLAEGRTLFIYLTYSTSLKYGGQTQWFQVYYPPDDSLPFTIERCDIQLPLNTLLYSNRPSHTAFIKLNETVEMVNIVTKKNVSIYMDSNHHGTKPFHMPPGKYSIALLEEEKKEFTLKRGGVYTTWYIAKSVTNLYGKFTPLTEPLSIDMEWQIPQYVIMGFAYFLYPVTLLQFTYQQVPVRMKPFVLACWYFTMILGHLLIATLATLLEGQRLLYVFVLYGSLMALDWLIVLIVFHNHENVGPEEEEEKENNSRKEGSSQ